MTFPKKIKGERIVLHHPQRPTFKLAKDLYIVANASRETILPWLPWPEKMKSPEDEFMFLQNWVHKNWQEKKGYAYIVKDIKNNRILGMLDFVRVDEKNHSGEIGYWLSSEATGHGYISEALQILEKIIFSEGFNRVVIRNDTRNTRSVNVAKRNGYHLDGVMRQVQWLPKEAKYMDMNIWSKLKNDL